MHHFFPTNTKSLISWYFLLYFLKHSKKYINLDCRFWSTATFIRTWRRCIYASFLSHKYQIIEFLVFSVKVFWSINLDCRFWSTATFKDNKFLLPKRSEQQKTEKYQGSADRGELDLNSDVNLLASGKLRQ